MTEVDMKLIEIDNTDKVAMEIKKVPIKQIIEQHRKRWLFKIPDVGDVILMKLRKLDMDEVARRLVNESADYLRLIKEAEPLIEKSKYDKALTPEEATELAKIGEQLAPFVKCFSVRCVVEPQLYDPKDTTTPIMETVDALDALISVMTADYSEIFFAVLGELSNPRPHIQVDDSVLILSHEYNIPLPKDLTIETMTAEQASVLLDSSAENAKRIKNMMTG